MLHMPRKMHQIAVSWLGWLWRTAACIGLLLYLFVCSAILLTYDKSTPPESPARWASSSQYIVLALVAWVVNRRERTTNSARALAWTQVAKTLRQRYARELAQSSRETLELTLALKPQPDAVQQVAPRPEEITSASIQDAYAQAQGSLLILGQPGAGKSTLLLELASDLAERAERDETQPFPFILPLSSWDAGRPAIEEWITEQVTLLYKIPLALAKQWLNAGLVLPLLDGLDEMSA